MEKIAWEKRKKGKTVWVKYEKIWMNEKWWRWNEKRKELVEREREERKEKRGEEGGTK